MPYFTVDDTSIYYEEHGAGPPVVLLHGLGSSTQDWFAQIPHLAERYRVIACDLRGHGKSGIPPGPYSIAQFARDVAVVLRRLDATPAHVVGLSMGGMVAFELAVGAPALVRSLVVINSMADMRLHTPRDVWFYVSRRTAVKLLGMRRVGQIIARKLFVKDDQDDLRTQFVERWARNDADAYAGSIDAIMGWTVTDRLDRLTMPILLVSSDHDYTPVSRKNRLAARLPDADLAVIDDARHAAPVEHPDTLNRLIDDFVRRVESSS